jgi:hypothetical protein
MKPTISVADTAPHTTPANVRAGSPAALLAIVPHLLGFVPEASLVVIGTAPPRDRVKVRSGMTCPIHPTPPWPRTSPRTPQASSGGSG